MKNSSLPVIDIKKYGGKQVAIVDGKIVASGKTLSEVLARAKKLYPTKATHEIKIFGVPPTIHVIYSSQLLAV